MVGFSNIISHKIIKDILKNDVLSQRLAQSYIFFGPEGIGKKLTAYAFSAFINCQKRSEDICGNCTSCIMLKKGVHPDIFLIKREGENILVDQINELHRISALKPFISFKKVFIIDEAERLTLEASNKLLKILEEPPAHIVIILITKAIDKLPPTVISRCKVLRFRRLKEEEIESFLKKLNPNYNEEEIKLISSLSCGSISKALFFLDFFENKKEETILIIKSLLHDDIFKMYNTISKIVRSYEKDDLILLLDLIFIFIKFTLFKEKFPKFLDLSYFNEDLLFEFEENLLKSRDLLLYSNVNPMMIFENLFLSLRR